MAAPRRSGTVPSLVSGPERRSDISRKAGEANTQDLAWGIGTPRHGARAGKNNAVHHFVNVSAGAGTYTLAHTLGAVPVAVDVVELRYPGAPATIPHISVEHVNPERWTTSVAKVNIIETAGGSLAGCVAKLMVRGA